MGLSAELSLNFGPSSFRPKTITGFMCEVSPIGDGFHRGSMLDEYVKCLEVERCKIDGLKRELPLSMSLIRSAIDALKLEAEQCKSAFSSPPVLEASIPIIGSKIDDDEEETKSEGKDFRDKMEWMSSAQLWSDNRNNRNGNNHAISSKKAEPLDAQLKLDALNRSDDDKPLLGDKYGSGGGALRSNQELSGQQAVVGKGDKTIPVAADLSLMTPASQNMSSESDGDGLSSKTFHRVNQSSISKRQADLSPRQQQQMRKARRCWSQDLHRKFINALEQLGGAQVATPKQIREQMKVDGLTNDEVKSHLQKYRLHLKRSPASTFRSSSQHVFLSGGIWASHNHYQVSKPNDSQSGSPPGPLELVESSRRISSPGGGSCEEEDDNSDNNSW